MESNYRLAIDKLFMREDRPGIDALSAGDMNAVPEMSPIFVHKIAYKYIEEIQYRY